MIESATLVPSKSDKQCTAISQRWDRDKAALKGWPGIVDRLLGDAPPLGIN